MVSIDIVAVVLVLAAVLDAINDRYVRLPAPIGMLLGIARARHCCWPPAISRCICIVIGPIRNALSGRPAP